MPQQPRRHLRDVATICPVSEYDSLGRVAFRCERDTGHDGKHKDGCTHWGRPNAEAAGRS
jgi:hypothetical protein